MATLRTITGAGAFLLLGIGASAAQGRTCGSTAPIDTLDDLGPALHACWRPPTGSEGKQLTLKFSLRRDGTLLGKPQATFSKLQGASASDKTFVASVLQALEEALPLPLTDRLGGAIAGRPLTLRFVGPTQGAEL